MAAWRASNFVGPRPRPCPVRAGGHRSDGARPTGGVYPEDQLYRLWTLLLTEIWSGINSTIAARRVNGEAAAGPCGLVPDHSTA